MASAAAELFPREESSITGNSGSRPGLKGELQSYSETGPVMICELEHPSFRPHRQGLIGMLSLASRFSVDSALPSSWKHHAVLDPRIHFASRLDLDHVVFVSCRQGRLRRRTQQRFEQEQPLDLRLAPGLEYQGRSRCWPRSFLPGRPRGGGRGHCDPSYLSGREDSSMTSLSLSIFPFTPWLPLLASFSGLSWLCDLDVRS